MTQLWLALVPVLLIVAGLSVRFAVRLVYGPRGAALGDWVHAMAMVFSWMLIGLGLAPVFLLLGATGFGMFFVLMALVAVVEGVTGGRAALRRVNAALLAELAERPDGFDTGASLATVSSRGAVGAATRKLFGMVRSGAPVSDALRRSPGAAPPEASAVLAVGQMLGDAPGAMRLLARSGSSSLSAIYRNVAERFFYLSVVTIILLCVLTFVLVWIVPEYRQIFDEFAMETPPLSSAVLAATGPTVNLATLPIAALCLLVGAVAPIVVICYLCDQPILRPLTDRIGWSLRVAEAHRLLGLAALRGGDFGVVLERIAALHPSGLVRRRASAAAGGIAAGDDWTAALRSARLLDGDEQSLVQAGAAAGNLPWVFETLALRRERRLGYRASAAVQILFPAAIIALAALVGLVVVALFQPLTELINALA